MRKSLEKQLFIITEQIFPSTTEPLPIMPITDKCKVLHYIILALVLPKMLDVASSSFSLEFLAHITDMISENVIFKMVF